jgi:HD superfamily phosphohydrolase
MLRASFLQQMQDLYRHEDGDLENFDSEIILLQEALEKIEADLDQYELDKPLGRGGSGIVIRVRDRRLDLPRALKLPRPRGSQMLDSVKQEMSHLVKVRHQNIIALHTMNEVPVDHFLYPYFVMDYIEGAKDLRKRTSELIASAASRSELGSITEWLAKRLLDTARAIDFLHRNMIIHFDVKPANVLIDASDRPILSDLGFAKRQTDSADSVVVGFTLFYAHPDLATHYLSGSSQNRIRKQMSPRNFNKVWDIFAFGKSILEILALIDKDFPDAVSYDPTFLYLHLAACRMLDGHNLSDDEVQTLMLRQSGDDYLNYRETWMNLGRPELRQPGIRYTSMNEVVLDLEKLTGASTVLAAVPELDLYYPHRIQCSGGIPAPFSHRVKKMVEHPVVARLASVPHLGFVRYIYPTATHTRLEHTLGAFRNCAQYLGSLYQDPYNPFFRQVVSELDLKSVLISSLLHDIGHYPLAHELEEVSSEMRHESLTSKFLESEAKDNDGHTLKEIIENEVWGWGVSTEEVKNILGSLEVHRPQGLLPMSDLKRDMLSSIIDGPLDVDKLDYLVRDSTECRLPYGQLIDQDRLIRNLTMVFGDSEEGRVELGVYEKGQSAAESLVFARYLMYQAVYWHHSARAIRSMLKTALGGALKRREPKSNSFIREFEKLIGLDGNVRELHIDDIVGLIGKWTDDCGKEMVELVRRRRFYKRIFSLHDDMGYEEGRESKLELFRNASTRPEFLKKLQVNITDSFVTKVSAVKGQSKFSQLGENEVDRTVERLGLPGAILVDAPAPSFGSARSLRILPEPQRLQRNYLTRVETGQRISAVWSKVHHRLMRVASKGRIFCHPDIRDSLMAAVGPEEISKILTGLIKEFGR